MSLESFSKTRMAAIFELWLCQFDDSVAFTLPDLVRENEYTFKFTAIAIDKEVTE